MNGTLKRGLEVAQTHQNREMNQRSLVINIVNTWFLEFRWLFIFSDGTIRMMSHSGFQVRLLLFDVLFCFTID